MLKITNAYKTFNAETPNEVKALRGVSLSLNPGDFVVVIGSNGSGKSTLQNAVAGAFILDSGKINVADRNVTTWAEHRRASLIGRVFQNPFSGTAPGMSIEENIALASRRGMFRGLGTLLNGKLRRQIQERISILKMGLEDRLSAPIGTLSGGQRQAITLLMATWNKPSILLLDEHTAALDPKSADKIIHLTKQIIDEQKLTALMVTHSMSQAANLGNRLVMMHKGKIARNIEGKRKQRVRPNDLLDMFEEIRRRELLDESAAEMLRRVF